MILRASHCRKIDLGTSMDVIYMFDWRMVVVRVVWSLGQISICAFMNVLVVIHLLFLLSFFLYRYHTHTHTLTYPRTPNKSTRATHRFYLCVIIATLKWLLLVLLLLYAMLMWIVLLVCSMATFGEIVCLVSMCAVCVCCECAWRDDAWNLCYVSHKMQCHFSFNGNRVNVSFVAKQ